MKYLDLIGKRRVMFIISAIIILLGIASAVFKGFNWGIDFTGGTALTIRVNQLAQFPEKINEILGKTRQILKKLDLTDSVIQRTEKTDLSIRIKPLNEEQRTKLIAELQNGLGKIEVLEIDTIGPIIGKALRLQSFWALLAATIGIIIYVSFRFEFRYAIAAILALYHDVIITVGFVSFLGLAVDLPFVAAILTIIGYSINDTIVIFDRIRENSRAFSSSKKPFPQLVNESILQTLARSINTVLTVLIVNLALVIWGGSTIRDFSTTLFIGFVCGAYSSIFIASPILVAWDNWKK